MVMMNALKLTALYQWVWNIDGGFNWYGVGGGVGTMAALMVINTVILLYLQLEISVSNITLIFLLISLDFRPEFGGNGY
jgi:hypothetical protein